MIFRYQRRMLCLLLLFAAQGSSLWAAPVKSASKQADGVLVQFSTGILRLQVMSDAVVRVTYAAGDALPVGTRIDRIVTYSGQAISVTLAQ